VEVRIDQNWTETSVLPLGATGVANFTAVIANINPGLAQAGYPLTWTNYTYTITGLPAPTPCRIGFRYYVTNGGTLGTNSNTIGVDTFSIDRPLGTEDFFACHYAVYPNPAANVLYIDAKTDASLCNIQLTDLNGRVVKTINAATAGQAQINIGDLNAGVYLLKIASDLGVGTSKIIKN
jgi:hypothetical protein